MRKPHLPHGSSTAAQGRLSGGRELALFIFLMVVLLALVIVGFRA
jgi:hypothetical protein